MVAEFEATFDRFGEWVARASLGPLALNQWELTYVDSFARGDYWEVPGDWSRFLPSPSVGNLFPTEGLGIALEHRGAEWAYEIEPKRGRLHVVARLGRQGENGRDSLLLQTTCRGPVGKGGAETLRAGLDLGHRVAVGAFLRMTDRQVQNRWGTQS